MTDDFDPARNSFGCFKFAVMAIREIGVRSGEYPPISDQERRQAAAGPVANSRLDCVMGAAS